MIRLLTVMLLGLTLAPSAVNAEWILDGVIVTDAPDAQLYARAAPDGRGGAIIIWTDYRTYGETGTYGMYAQRVDQCGTVAWNDEGVPVVTGSYPEQQVDIAPDGCGGAVIVWAANSDIYAQRLDSLGVAYWGVNGTPVCAAPESQVNPKVTLVSGSELIVVWIDTRVGGSTYNIYGQYLDELGNAVWGANGIPICSTPDEKTYHTIVADGSGGAIVSWMDRRSQNFDIYTQRVNSLGQAVWTGNGVPVATGDWEAFWNNMAACGDGGAVITWTDWRDIDGRGNGVGNVFAQRIGPGGDFLWTMGGVRLSDTPTSSEHPHVVSDHAGGAVFVWLETPPYQQWVHAQHVDSTGVPDWSPDGIVVGEADPYTPPLVVSDGVGGAIVTWLKGNVYAQHVTASGTKEFDVSLLAGTRGSIRFPEIASDGAGGAIVVWTEWRTFDENIYCQRAYGNGTWAKPNPSILEIRDVPNDQGGTVRLHVARSAYDQEGAIVYPVLGYNVWRRIRMPVPTTGSSASFPAGEVAETLFRGLSSCGDESRDIVVPKALSASLGFPGGNWESLGYHAAIQSEFYNLTVSTLTDSASGTEFVATYVVTAHTRDPSVYFVSAPDSGYSVDNLAPNTPEGLAGQYDSVPDLLTLHWTANTESDLSDYRVYRGEGPDFVPSNANLIATTPDTLLTGLDYFPTDPWYIKVSAVDIHGNESGFAVLPPEFVTIATLVSSYQAIWVQNTVEVSWNIVDAATAFDFEISRKSQINGSYKNLVCTITESENGFSFRDGTTEPGQDYWYRVMILEDGRPLTSFETSITTPSVEFALHQNYPNPFNPSTRIAFTLENDGPVSLRIYDAMGKLVRTLLSGGKTAGSYTEEWDGRDDLGNEVSSGVYFYQLITGNRTLTRKAVVIR